MTATKIKIETGPTSRVIKLDFKRDADGDYHAEADTATYSILKSTDAGFGLSVHPKKGWLHPEGARRWIMWLGTKKLCVHWANGFANQHPIKDQE